MVHPGNGYNNGPLQQQQQGYMNMNSMNMQNHNMQNIYPQIAINGMQQDFGYNSSMGNFIPSVVITGKFKNLLL